MLSPRADDQVEMLVKSTLELDNYQFLIMQSSQVLYKSNEKVFMATGDELEFTATPEMKYVNAIAYYQNTETGQIIYDDVSINFEESLDNFVS